MHALRGLCGAVLMLAALLAPVTLVVAPAASAATTTTTPLPFTGFGALAVDPVHGKVYISAGKTDARIAVLSTSGQLKKTLTDLPGASALAFDPSLQHVVTVSLSSREIAKIDKPRPRVSPDVSRFRLTCQTARWLTPAAACGSGRAAATRSRRSCTSTRTAAASASA